MAELNPIKKLNGQPWSSWKKLCNNGMTGEEVSESNPQCIKLDRADMPIYGLTPKSEIFELVVCNYCGLKYKLPAFAEHINLRHSGDNKKGPCGIDIPAVAKKGKLKKAKEKFKVKTESVTLKVDNKTMKIDFLEIVSDRQSLTIDSETVSKLKQIHANTKTIVNSSEVPIIEDTGVLNIGSCCVIKPELNKEILSQKLNDSNVLKTLCASSNLSQEGVRVNMQPIVKLSPIHSTPNLQSIDIEKNEQNRTPLRRNSSNPELSYNVYDETRPSLQCFSGEKSIIIKSQIQPVEQLISEVVPESSIIVPPKSDNNIPILVKNEPIIPSKDCVEENKKERDCEFNYISPIKHNTNDLHGLSLPVSIKNPSILCQLQNIKSKYYIPAKVARYSTIEDVLKGNLAQKYMNLQLNSPSSKENSESVLVDLEGTDKKPAAEFSELKPQWHPGYRRVGGLLYANHSIARLRRRTFITSFSPVQQEEHYNSFLQQRLNVISDKSEIIDFCDSDSSKTELKRTHGNKKSINSIVTKPKNNFIMSSNAVPQKLHLNPTNNKGFICKRTSNNMNGIVPAKVKRQDGMVNIISPIFGKINKTCL